MSTPPDGPAPGQPAASRPRRAQVEFLLRDREGEGFRTVTLGSEAAYLSSRPQRILDGQWELARLPYGPAGSATYALKNRRTQQILEITEDEKFLWERMDGQTSMQEIGVAFLLRSGSFDFDVIRMLIAKLNRAELLTMQPASRLRRVLARNRRNPAARAAEATLHALERLTVRTERSHEVFQRIHRWGGFLLFSPLTVGAVAVITLLGARGAVQLWAHSGEITAALAQNPLIAILLVKVVFWLTVVSHQIIHALACVHYGRRVREFGFTMLHGFIPTFYADVTDTFMGTRRARVVNSLAGPLVHLFLGALCLWTASLVGPGLLQAFLAASAVLQLQSLFVSLYPFCFLELDGYHVLVEMVGMPRLNQDAAGFVRRRLWRRLLRGPWLTRREGILVGYFALSLVSWAAFVLANVWLIVAAGRA